MSRVPLVPLFLLCLIALPGGCASPAAPRTADEQAMFAPVSFRIHPTFTQIKDWSGQKKPDGIEALLEFTDQFGDPTRAAGTVRFELYNYRADDPDHRGQRLAIWTGSMNSRDDQVAHWDAAARGYSFQLAFPAVRNDHAYVLTAQIDRPGSRLFDQLVVESTAREGFHGDRRTRRAPPDAPQHGS